MKMVGLSVGTAVMENSRSAPEPTYRPNLIVLLTDDQRWDAVGCMGNPIVKTPEMDRLAREGTLFTKSFVTSAVCAASRASIFTGQYERTHGCNFNKGPLSRRHLQRSYPMLLRETGYETAFVGKYGVGDAGEREIEADEVFDAYYGFYGQGKYFPNGEDGQHLTQLMLEDAEDFFDKRDAGRPFCLSISFKAPHSGVGYLELTPDPALRDLYEDVQIPLPDTAKAAYFEALPEFLQKSNARYNYWELRYSTPEKYQEIMRDYYRLITGVDVVLGRLRASLEKRGLADNTVIVFLSDNGEMTGDYMLGGKELLYDASIRVPMIVYDPRAPERARGQHCGRLALNIDVAPTLLDYAGIQAPDCMQGRSLVPLVRGETPTWRESFFCENDFCVESQYYPRIEGVRTERWKYVRYPEIEPVYEQLFDLDADPQEVNDLARDERGTGVLQSLREKCDRYTRQLDAARSNTN